MGWLVGDHKNLIDGSALRVHRFKPYRTRHFLKFDR